MRPFLIYWVSPVCSELCQFCAVAYPRTAPPMKSSVSRHFQPAFPAETVRLSDGPQRFASCRSLLQARCIADAVADAQVGSVRVRLRAFCGEPWAWRATIDRKRAEPPRLRSRRSAYFRSHATPCAAGAGARYPPDASRRALSISSAAPRPMPVRHRAPP